MKQSKAIICSQRGKCDAVYPMQLDVAKELKLASGFQDQNSFW